MSDDLNSPTVTLESRSTILDGGSGTALGGGKPSLSEDRPKEDVRSSLEAAFKEVKANPETDDGEPAKAEPKAEKGDKVEAKDTKKLAPDAVQRLKEGQQGKAEQQASADDQQAETREPAKADAGTERDEKTRPVSDGRRYQAPARFLTSARDVYANTPRAVQAEIARMEADYTAEVETYKTQAQEYEPLKPFAERAKAGGRNLHQVMSGYVQMEDALRQNPAQGFRSLLENMKMTPTQAVTAIAQAYGGTAQDFAKLINERPDLFNPVAVQRQPPIQNAPQQQPQQDPRVDALEKQLRSMQMEKVQNDIVQPLVDEIGADRYAELEEKIALLLNDDRFIPRSLNPRDRLREAYILADRLLPASTPSRSSDPDAGLDPASRVAPNLNGTKSVKSSLGGPVTDVSEPEEKKPMREMLAEEMRKLKRA